MWILVGLTLESFDTTRSAQDLKDLVLNLQARKSKLEPTLVCYKYNSTRGERVMGW